VFIIGSDEVGYGSWAGPLYVCAYVAPEGWTVPGLNDSKKLSPRKREEVYTRLDLTRSALVSVEPQTIDEFGLGHCLARAHLQVIQELIRRGYQGARIVVDGNLRLPMAEAESIPKADTTVPAVMAASVIAKCNRDLFMRGLHQKYPQYGFASHVGYGTPEHMAALRAYGPCPVHRMSYQPLKDVIEARRAG
jgi:ribonuclease HII